MYVDGVERSHLNGDPGTIDNAIPMTVGGKINCDQVEITCDYFSGQIDYVSITKSVNATPIASPTASCTGQACGFNGSSSTDPDGTVAGYAWSFGDGGTSTAVDPSHRYAAAGTYHVTLTVTDNQGGTGHLDDPGHRRCRRPGQPGGLPRLRGAGVLGLGADRDGPCDRPGRRPAADAAASTARRSRPRPRVG